MTTNKSEWQRTVEDVFAGKKAIEEIASTENYGRVKLDGVTIVTDANGKIKVADDFVGNGTNVPIEVADVNGLQVLLDDKASQSDLNTLAQDLSDNKTQITSNSADIATLGQRVNDLENEVVEVSDITFDNTDTGLVSANVQDVIKEVNIKVDGLDSDFDNYNTQLSNINGRLDRVEIDNGNQDTKISDLEAKDLSIENDIALVKNEYHKIKASASDMSASYLDGKVDNLTVEIVSDKLVVKSLNGLTIGVSDLNSWLSGTSSNIQNQINTIQSNMTSLATGMNFEGKVATHADLGNIANQTNGSLVVVLADESLTGGRSLYVYSDTLNDWDFIGEFVFSDAFLELTDTPTSYIGSDGKVVKVDEANGKLVFSNVDWSELQNKPVSNVTAIDDAVTKSHEHLNENVLDNFSESTEGKLLYKGALIEGSSDTGGGRDFTTTPLNLITESTAILPINRYEKPKAENIEVTDVNNNFTSNNIEGVLAELFQFADSGKKQISSAIGAPLTANDTFIEIKDKIIQLKTLLAEAITEHGVPTYPQNSLNEMIDKLKLVSRITVEGDVVKLDNIKITAPTERKLVLADRLNISDVLLSVREVMEGKDNYVHFELDFTGSDASFFEPNPNVVFDGELKLTPTTIEIHTMDKDESWTDTGFVNTYLVVRDDETLNKIVILFNDVWVNNTLILHENTYKYYDSTTSTWTNLQSPILAQTFEDYGMDTSIVLERKDSEVEIGEMTLIENADGYYKYNKNVDLDSYKDISKVDVEDINNSKLVLTSQDKTYSASSEVIRHETNMTSNFLPQPLTASSSSYYSALFLPWRAFNGTNSNVDDCWASVNGTTTGWIQIDFGSRKKVNKLTMWNRNSPTNVTNATTTFPKDFKVLGSNDGIDYVEITSIQSAIPTTINQRMEFYLPESNYSMYRIEILSNHGWTAYSCIANILYSYETISFTELPNSSIENINKYGAEKLVDGLNNPSVSKKYILQDENSRGTDGLMRVSTTSRISTIAFRRNV